MTSYANLSFRSKINAQDDCGLDPAPSPGAWEEFRRHLQAVSDTTAEYLRRCGRDAAECSHLGKGEKEALQEFHLRFRAFMGDEFFPLLKEAEAAASIACLEAAE